MLTRLDRFVTAAVDRLPEPLQAVVRRLTPIGTVVALVMVASTATSFAGLWRGLETPAATGRWHIERFHADLTAREDGALEVAERLDVRFDGTFRGLIRRIPARYETGAGFAFDLRIAVDTVTDGAGRPLRHEVGTDGPYRTVRVWVPDATHATRTVVIGYTARRAIRHEPDFDEIYWNVTGTEWPVRIEAASVAVHLPPGARSTQAALHTGPYGATGNDAELTTLTDTLLTARTTGPLPPRHGLTVDVATAPEAIARPALATRAGWWLRDNWPLGLPLLALAGMGWLWWARGRDPNVGPVAVRYEPPEGATPAELGLVIDDTPHVRDLVATIVDLAVRGHLVIEELGAGASERDDALRYGFRRRTGPEDWQQLTGHEQSLLRSMFDQGRIDWADPRSLPTTLGADLHEIRQSLTANAFRQGLYVRPPDEVQGFWWAVALGVALVAGLVGWQLAGLWGLAPVSVYLGGGGTAAVVAAFGWRMPVRTRQGMRRLREALGLKAFIARVEEDRFRRMIEGPEDFERLLPYAIAFGLEATWGRAFRGVFDVEVDWWQGATDDPFQPHRFHVHSTNLGHTASWAAAAGPREAGRSGASSAGGGFSVGGGFSGGGFGGGGGGAF